MSNPMRYHLHVGLGFQLRRVDDVSIEAQHPNRIGVGRSPVSTVCEFLTDEQLDRRIADGAVRIVPALFPIDISANRNQHSVRVVGPH